MGTDHGGGGPVGSNHPALACASASPPYPRRGTLSRRPSLKKGSNRFNLHLKLQQRGS